MSRTRVGVIGAGIAGPVAAMFLKQKGYDPVLYERLDSPSNAGLSIGYVSSLLPPPAAARSPPSSIQWNGLVVLSKIPGLLEYIDGNQVDEFHFYSVLPEDLGLLGVSDHFRRHREATGFGTVGVERPLLQNRLVEFAQKLDIPVNFGYKLENLEQTEDGVTVTFANGVKEAFSFVVGCDGLHSNTRSCLFGETPADYTGVSQVRLCSSWLSWSS